MNETELKCWRRQRFRSGEPAKRIRAGVSVSGASPIELNRQTVVRVKVVIKTHTRFIAVGQIPIFLGSMRIQHFFDKTAVSVERSRQRLGVRRTSRASARGLG